MAKGIKIEEEKLRELYQDGLSMQKISEKLNCSLHKVAYWMSKYGLSRRTRSEATYLSFNPNGDPFSIREIKTIDDALLMGLGLGIYFGEGTKVAPHQVRVANTDPVILTLFIKFLIDICGLRKDKISYSIVCFNDSNVEDVVNYWSSIFSIPKEKFGKIVQIPPQGKGTYKRKSQYGVCTVNVNNVKLKQWLLKKLVDVKI